MKFVLIVSYRVLFHHSFLITLSCRPFPALSPYIRFPQLASPPLPRLLRKRIYSDKTEWMEKDIRIIQKWMNEAAHGCLTFWMISFSNLYDVLASLLYLERHRVREASVKIFEDNQLLMFSKAVREVVKKKRIFYGQTDHKGEGGPPPPAWP